MASSSILGFGNQDGAEHAGYNVAAVASNSITPHTYDIFNYSSFNITITRHNHVERDNNRVICPNLMDKSAGSFDYVDLGTLEDHVVKI